MEEDEWLFWAPRGESPAQDHEVTQPEHWHLVMAQLAVDQDGQEAWIWHQEESPNLAEEWSGWVRYVPSAVSWN